MDWVGPFPRVKGRSDFRQEPLFEELTQPSVAMGLSLQLLGYRGRVVHSRLITPHLLSLCYDSQLAGGSV